MGFVDLDKVIESGDAKIINFFKKEIIDNFNDLKLENKIKIHQDKNKYEFNDYYYALPSFSIKQESSTLTDNEYYNLISSMPYRPIESKFYKQIFNNVSKEVIIEWCYKSEIVFRKLFKYDPKNILNIIDDIDKLPNVKVSLEYFIKKYIDDNDKEYLKKIIKFCEPPRDNKHIYQAIEKGRYDIIKIFLKEDFYCNKMIAGIYIDSSTLKYVKLLLKYITNICDDSFTKICEIDRSLALKLLKDKKYTISLHSRTAVKFVFDNQVFDLIINHDNFEKINLHRILNDNRKCIENVYETVKKYPSIFTDEKVDYMYFNHDYHIGDKKELTSLLLENDWIKNADPLLAKYVYNIDNIDDIYDRLPDYIRDYIAEECSYLPKGTDKLL